MDKYTKLYLTPDKNNSYCVSFDEYGIFFKCYKITKEHSALIEFYDTINLVDDLIPLFNEYTSHIFDVDSDKREVIYKSLLDNLYKLHPIFKSRDSSMRSLGDVYLRNQIRSHFKKSFLYYIVHFYIIEPAKDIDEVYSSLKTCFINLIEPTYDSLDRVQSNIDYEWYNFFAGLEKLSPYYKMNEQGTKKMVSDIYSDYARKSNNLSSFFNYILDKEPFQDLIDLRRILFFYRDKFSNIVKTKKLNSLQSIYIFSNSSIAEPMKDSLRNIRCISTPDYILNSVSFHQLNNNSENEDIMITTTTHSLSEFAKNLYNSDNYDIKSSDIFIDTLTNDPESTDILYFDRMISTKFNNLLNSPSYELYTFEQIIYFEIYIMILNGEFFHKCESPDCSRLFITSDRRKHYCNNCENNKKIRDKTYRSKRTSYDRIINTVYQRKRRQLSAFIEEEDAENEKKKIRSWLKIAKQYISKINEENSDLDEAEITKKLNEMYLNIKQ